MEELGIPKPEALQNCRKDSIKLDSPSITPTASELIRRQIINAEKNY